MNWGWKITAVYVTFVIGMLTLVFKASSKRVELVTKDYYAQELAYSKRLEAQRNMLNLSSTPSITIMDNTLMIELPTECTNVKNYHIQLYCPANSANDRIIEGSTSGGMAVPLHEIPKGVYVVKLSFTIEQKEYFFEQAIEHL